MSTTKNIIEPLIPLTKAELFHEKHLNSIQTQTISQQAFNELNIKALHLEYTVARDNAYDILKQLSKKVDFFGYFISELSVMPPIGGVHSVTLYLEQSARELKNDTDCAVNYSKGFL